MSEQKKVVTPEVIRAYGRTVNGKIDTIFTALNQLCVDVVEVEYHGTNAFNFKTQAGEKAAAFGKEMVKSINALKEAIAAATSNISGALGGESIALDLSDNALTPQSPNKPDGSEVADPTALNTLVQTVTTRFSEITTAVDENLRALTDMPREAPGWQGDARDSTEQVVGDWTKSVKTLCENSEKDLTTFIKDQNTAVQERDAAIA
jgi:Flp pilus assembly pilin Flp